MADGRVRARWQGAKATLWQTGDSNRVWRATPATSTSVNFSTKNQIIIIICLSC
jgi:hypothetical protein